MIIKEPNLIDAIKSVINNRLSKSDVKVLEIKFLIEQYEKGEIERDGKIYNPLHP